MILLSAIILQERQAGLDYLMSILQASLLPSVTYAFTLSEVLWWEPEQLLVSTTHLVGFLPEIDSVMGIQGPDTHFFIDLHWPWPQWHNQQQGQTTV